ncbi:PucR C-terminal helix-turn-helix domain-containing protein [Thalassobacillus cyri]|uniref:PucR C-terminal helix-turn-helix domain-containing protein n=1 Tax=Thalassobacillus cyri TaxID=571932 RepID=A0A1H4GHS8_9BACI|nr:helix-turn-helix domain-containing protein [Thalassobacillus cyri]SEB09114.1 PucR C-terminal helix-turn-helix domain-containing protein [Thalassobacillus cyri]
MIIIEKIKSIYPSLVQLPCEKHLDANEYKWFRTETDEIIGIKKSELSSRESDMLEIFLTPYYYDTPYITEREQQWIDLIYHHQPENLNENNPPGSFRFVFFKLSERSAEPETFREAIQGLFSVQMPIIWENDHTGFIIEERKGKGEEKLSFEQIIDVLMSDFYRKLSFYVSEFVDDIGDAPSHFSWSKHCFYIAQNHLKKDVTNFLDVIPYVYLDQLPDDQAARVTQAILQEVIQETDLLHTVQVFLECNSNATLTSKKLYMHRNSLQYRIDKFIEKTGIDVRQFQFALPTYLALLQMKINSWSDR